MSNLRCVLVVLVAMVLALSFAVPVEDDPETTYDETETLPYESTPLFSSDALQVVARLLQSPPSFCSPLGPGFRTRRDEGRTKCRHVAAHAVNYLMLLDCQLRC
jgi:hypothetical protein